MRLLLLQVPRGRGDDALRIAKTHGGVNLARLEGAGDGKPLDIVLTHIPNRKVEGFIEAVDELPHLRVTLLPHGIIPLWPPDSEAPEEVKHVGPRSPVEVFVGGLQAVGSWSAYLSYAAAGGAVVWMGLTTNTIFLLTAAMLIAPFAGPAMAAAMATARGDRQLLNRSLIRYGAGLAVSAAVSLLLTILFGPDVVTNQVQAQSQISGMALLLPLLAGAAGALNLVQSERNSLVSGAATGMLVAASLAPPIGIVGIAVATGRWDLVQGSAFVILLQLVGINLSGAMVFRLYGLSARGARYSRGRNSVTYASATVTVMALAGLLWWQFSGTPDLMRSSQSQRAVEVIQHVVEETPGAALVEADARFTRPGEPIGHTLLGTVYVQRLTTVLPAESLRAVLSHRIQDALLAERFDATPLISVTVLDAPHARTPPR